MVKALHEMNLLERLSTPPWAGEPEKIQAIFDALQLPVPQAGEFLPGADHSFKFFLNKYNVAISVERIQTDPADANYNYTRNDDNPMVSQPVAEITTGNVRIVILPGVRVATTREQKLAAKHELEKLGMAYTDDTVTNTGLWPVRTDRFPEGVPHSLDRGAVKTQAQAESKDATGFSPRVVIGRSQLSPDFALAVEQVEELVRKPLTDRFNEAWPDTSDPSTVKPHIMKGFWELCRQMGNRRAPSGQDMLLTDGWNHRPQDIEDVDHYCAKTQFAAATAAQYAQSTDRYQGNNIRKG